MTTLTKLTGKFPIAPVLVFSPMNQVSPTRSSRFRVSPSYKENESEREREKSKSKIIMAMATTKAVEVSYNCPPPPPYIKKQRKVTLKLISSSLPAVKS